MKLTRSGVIAVAIAAAFFAGSMLTMAVAGGNGAQNAKKKKKAKRGPAGPAGAQGPAGAAGAPGAPGAPGSGVANIHVRLVSQSNVANGAATTRLTKQCNGGERVIGGGAYWANGPYVGAAVAESFASVNNNGTAVGDGGTPTDWTGSGFNNSGTARDFIGQVVCIS